MNCSIWILAGAYNLKSGLRKWILRPEVTVTTWVCWEFYGPVNTRGHVETVSLSFLRDCAMLTSTHCALSFTRNWQLSVLNKRERRIVENIFWSICQKMLPDLVRIKPVTSRSPVTRIQLSTITTPQWSKTIIWIIKKLTVTITYLNVVLQSFHTQFSSLLESWVLPSERPNFQSHLACLTCCFDHWIFVLFVLHFSRTPSSACYPTVGIKTNLYKLCKNRGSLFCTKNSQH